MPEPGPNPSPEANERVQVFMQKKQLREINARMDDLRGTMSAMGEEVRSTRATIAEHQEVLKGLRQTIEAARQERDALEIRRAALKEALGLTPGGHDDERA